MTDSLTSLLASLIDDFQSSQVELIMSLHNRSSYRLSFLTWGKGIFIVLGAQATNSGIVFTPIFASYTIDPTF